MNMPYFACLNQARRCARAGSSGGGSVGVGAGVGAWARRRRGGDGGDHGQGGHGQARRRECASASSKPPQECRHIAAVASTKANMSALAAQSAAVTQRARRHLGRQVAVAQVQGGAGEHGQHHRLRDAARHHHPHRRGEQQVKSRGDHGEDDDEEAPPGEPPRVVVAREAAQDAHHVGQEARLAGGVGHDGAVERDQRARVEQPEGPGPEGLRCRCWKGRGSCRGRRAPRPCRAGCPRPAGRRRPWPACRRRASRRCPRA